MGKKFIDIIPFCCDNKEKIKKGEKK